MLDMARVEFYTDRVPVFFLQSSQRLEMLDTARVKFYTDRVPVSLAQIVDLLASFPKSGYTLKTELRVKIYDRFNFKC